RMRPRAHERISPLAFARAAPRATRFARGALTRMSESVWTYKEVFQHEIVALGRSQWLVTYRTKQPSPHRVGAGRRSDDLIACPAMRAGEVGGRAVRHNGADLVPASLSSR